MILDVVQYPNKALARKAIPVIDEFESPSLADFVENMCSTMSYHKGCGLAATQISSSEYYSQYAILCYSVKKYDVYCVTDQDLDNLEEATGGAYLNGYMINPEIISYHNLEEDEMLEGCLSLPCLWKTIKRAKMITVKSQDISGNVYTNTFSGYLAKIIQHEMDHLNGVTILSHISEEEKANYEIFLETKRQMDIAFSTARYEEIKLTPQYIEFNNLIGETNE